MKKIFIEGMVCQHCANAVQTALEEIGGTDISVNLDEGYAQTEINQPDEVIIARIAEEDFEVTEIK